MSDALTAIIKGREAINAGDVDSAATHFRRAAETDPEEPDAWNGLAAVAFERGDLEESVRNFSHAKELSVLRLGGKMPESVPWSNERNKPLLRAIHGIGLNKFRVGDLSAARQSFELLLRLNPTDEQGAGTLLDAIARKMSLWKKKM